MIKFDSVEEVYSSKTKKELYKSYFLFRLIKSSFITYTLTKILKISLFLRLPINSIIKSTVYEQFCGGVSIPDSEKVINTLWKSNIGTILDYSAEGKKTDEDFDYVVTEIIASIKKAKNTECIPFAVFKISGVSSYGILKKLNSKDELNSNEEFELKKIYERVEKICNEAYKSRVRLFIDAEESWIQNSIDYIVLSMMRKYNKKTPIIYNTIQFYRIDRIAYLKNLIQKAKKENFYLGLKLVRGAYHEKEIERSKRLSYNCPVHIEKKKTDLDFDLSLRICLKNIERVWICAGTHNEESSSLLVDLMKEYKIDKNDERIYFSQLYGMSDNISYNLSKNTYKVAKYVPYGPVKDVIPYLIRRMKENTSISGQVGRELKNITKEIKRRRFNQDK